MSSTNEGVVRRLLLRPRRTSWASMKHPGGCSSALSMVAWPSRHDASGEEGGTADGFGIPLNTGKSQAEIRRRERQRCSSRSSYKISAQQSYQIREVILVTISSSEMQRQSPPFIVASLAGVDCLFDRPAWTAARVDGDLQHRQSHRCLAYKGSRHPDGHWRSEARDVLGLILRESKRPIFAGLIAGSLLEAGASYLAGGLLYGLNDVDRISLAGVSLMFLIIGLVASYQPARRATRVDPLVALRYE